MKWKIEYSKEAKKFIKRCQNTPQLAVRSFIYKRVKI